MIRILSWTSSAWLLALASTYTYMSDVNYSLTMLLGFLSIAAAGTAIYLGWQYIKYPSTQSQQSTTRSRSRAKKQGADAEQEAANGRRGTKDVA